MIDDTVMRDGLDKGGLNLTSWTEPPIKLHRRPPSEDWSPVTDAIDELAVAIEGRLARLDSQLASVRRLLVQPPIGSSDLSIRTDSSVATISCLGPFRFRRGGVSVDNWRSGKARALFQYLINHRGQPIPRDTLIQALWPDPSAAAPGTSLKVAVHLLRQVLNQTEAADGENTGLAILSQGSCYQLNASNVWIDVEEFEHCCALGRSCEAQGKSSEARALYARAAELYRGDFLEELADDWPTFRREALKDQYLFVLARLATAATEEADYHDGIIWCQRLLAKDRCREDTYRMLMLCHARLGQRSRVRSWYDLCVRTIQTELDCLPEPETERTYRLALAGKL